MSQFDASPTSQQVIGLIGGMSWKSSAEYYRLINEGVRTQLGGLHSARCLMWSFDFADIEVLQRTDRWDEAAALMVDAAQRLERAGADFLVIATNTMHIAAPQVQAATSLHLLHIADPTAHSPVPLYDTTGLHAEAAVARALRPSGSSTPNHFPPPDG
jgi:aspartate racemase